jgi:hypothetical protein
MPADVALLASLGFFAVLIALPALGAASRRRAMREASEVAGELSALAQDVRERAVCQPIPEMLCVRARRLRTPEFASLLLAQELTQRDPRLLADAAHRLALRLKRRVAFERKMLARTASGRRRGAVAASVPPAVLLAMHAGGLRVPLAALVFILAVEACGCWLLWRIARVEI